MYSHVFDYRIRRRRRRIRWRRIRRRRRRRRWLIAWRRGRGSSVGVYDGASGVVKVDLIAVLVGESVVFERCVEFAFLFVVELV